MFCRTCGKEIIDEAVICPYCGCLTGVPQQPPMGQYGNQFVDKTGNPNTQFVDQYGNPINMTYDQYGNPNNPYNDRYGPQNNPFINQNQSNIPDEVNPGLVVLSVIIPLAGIILGATNQSSGRKKSGKAYLLAGVISWGVWFFLCILLGILAAVLD